MATRCPAVPIATIPAEAVAPSSSKAKGGAGTQSWKAKINLMATQVETGLYGPGSASWTEGGARRVLSTAARAIATFCRANRVRTGSSCTRETSGWTAPTDPSTRQATSAPRPGRDRHWRPGSGRFAGTVGRDARGPCGSGLPWGFGAGAMMEESLFAAALERTFAAERQAFLEEACAGDVALRRAGGAIARGPREDPRHPRPAGRAAGIAGRHCRVETRRCSPAEGAGTLVAGRYKLLEEIGEGGMGVVCMAEQTQPVRRKVALKIIKPGMDSRQVIARFEAERQALAMMDHPNIAKVLDAGTTAGRPALLRHGAGQGRADHRVLRRAQPDPARAAGAVHPGLPGGAARAPEGDHPPRPEAVERPGGPLRRRAGAQGHRLRRGQGDRAAADRADDCSRSSARSSARWST